MQLITLVAFFMPLAVVQATLYNGSGTCSNDLTCEIDTQYANPADYCAHFPGKFADTGIGGKTSCTPPGTKCTRLPPNMAIQYRLGSCWIVRKVRDFIVRAHGLPRADEAGNLKQGLGSEELKEELPNEIGARQQRGGSEILGDAVTKSA
ncbi:hypothetical protein LZ30DRAFT_692544 [Colletotrichum cereale]|nr:hypothetical protein LZ30DRAFT_692544 [Colletotrichum cereale]